MPPSSAQPEHHIVRLSSRTTVALLFFALAAEAPLQAHAALLNNCRPSDSDLVCRMRSLLTMLDTAAILLAILLVVAILAAIYAYRRKPRKLTPDDITPDAP